jgi:bifunctional DNA-binding transcriptional regulator/antitoxin component of YhaV-PrlF toxin-antitoxin module
MSEEFRVKVARDGGFVIPEAFRKTLGVEGGGEVLLHIQDGELVLTTGRRRSEHAQLDVRKSVKIKRSGVDKPKAGRQEA